MEPFRQSTRPRSSLAGAENILRIGRGEQPPANPAVRDGELTRKGQAALDLVSQVADTISATENRIETLLVRALEQLKTMEDRNRALEARAISGRGPRARSGEMADAPACRDGGQVHLLEGRAGTQARRISGGLNPFRGGQDRRPHGGHDFSIERVTNRAPGATAGPTKREKWPARSCCSRS